jgi:DNA-binding transcriptional regulator YdaS (Cro superfamily)
MTDPLHEVFRDVVATAGGQSAFARAVGTSQQRVSYRLLRGMGVPVELVLKTERAFGVSRHLLRPDIYPEE